MVLLEKQIFGIGRESFSAGYGFARVRSEGGGAGRIIGVGQG